MPAANFTCTAKVSDDGKEVTVSVTNNSKIVDNVHAGILVWVIDPQPANSYIETRFTKHLYFNNVPDGKTLSQVLQTEGWLGGGTNVWKICAKLLDS